MALCLQPDDRLNHGLELRDPGESSELRYTSGKTHVMPHANSYLLCQPIA